MKAKPREPSRDAGSAWTVGGAYNNIEEATGFAYSNAVGCPGSNFKGELSMAQSPLCESAAAALADKAASLCDSGRYEDAVAVEDEPIPRCREASLVDRQAAVDALHDKALILNQEGRTSESIAACAELARAYGEESEPAVMGKVAHALRMKATLLSGEERYGEVIEAVDELCRRFGDVEESSVRVSVAEGLGHKAFALGRRGRWDDAVMVDVQAIQSFPTTEGDDDLADVLARVMGHHAYSLERVGRLEQADAAWRAIIDRDRDPRFVVPSAIVADARQKRAEIAAIIGPGEDAIAAADELIAGLRADPEQVTRLIEALAVKGFALATLERWEDALEIFDEIVERGQGLTGRAARREVVLTLVNKSVALRELGRWEQWTRFSEQISSRVGEDGLTAFTEVADSLANAASEPGVRPVLAVALFHKAELLGDQGRRDEAVAAAAELITRFEDDETANIEGIVVLAREMIERLTAESEDRD